MAAWMKLKGMLDSDIPDNERMKAGRYLEGAIAQWFCDEEEKTLKINRFIYHHPDFPWMIATPDYFIDDAEGPGILEIKNTNRNFLDRWEDGKIANAAHAQALHYLAVTGLDYAYIAVLVGGNKFISRRIDRDEEAIDFLVEAEVAFHASLENNNPPDWEGDDMELLAQLYPAEEIDKSLLIQLPPEAADWVEKYVQGQAVEREGGKVKKEAQAVLCSMLGNHEEGYIGESQVSWKMQKRSAYTVEEKMYRRFRIRT
jgi:predicted phage-related endonuclease